MRLRGQVDKDGFYILAISLPVALLNKIICYYLDGKIMNLSKSYSNKDMITVPFK